MSEQQQETALSNRPASNGATAPAVPPPQYVQGFDGIAVEPFPETARAVLAAAVNPEEVETKPNGIVFLPGVAYRRILTRAFGAGGWALAPRSPARTMGNLITYHGALYALGRFVSEAVGECEYHANNASMSYASALEGARTDCLTRCCKDLGVATELWDPAWREWWQANYADKKWVDGSDGARGKYVWSRRTKGTAGGAAPAARNVGAPAAKPEAAPAPKAEATGVGAPADAAEPASATMPAGSPETGEAASHEEQQAVRVAAKALGWAAPRAGAWLKKHFGVATTGSMTKVQAADVLACLQAMTSSEAAYRAVLDRLVAEGRAAA